MSVPGEKKDDGKFLFLSQVTQIDQFREQNIYTHLINTGYKTKKGAPKYTLTIYQLGTDQVLAEYPAFEFMSRANKPYFKVLVKD